MLRPSLEKLQILLNYFFAFSGDKELFVEKLSLEEGIYWDASHPKFFK